MVDLESSLNHSETDGQLNRRLLYGLKLKYLLILGIPTFYCLIAGVARDFEQRQNQSKPIFTGRRLLGNPNCTPPAVDEFPNDIFTREQIESGAILLHLLLAFYLFLLLGVICEEYFVPSIKKICERLGVPEDVAGATFMAAATSSPELFINGVGTFITKGDIGVGTIVGSAVFNILAVPACCGLFANQVISLHWWPISRDCLMYGVAVILLIITLQDSRVEWYEALVLVLVYFAYLAAMYFNAELRILTRRCLRRKTAYKNMSKMEEIAPLISRNDWKQENGIHCKNGITTLSNGDVYYHSTSNQIGTIPENGTVGQHDVKYANGTVPAKAIMQQNGIKVHKGTVAENGIYQPFGVKHEIGSMEFNGSIYHNGNQGTPLFKALGGNNIKPDAEMAQGAQVDEEIQLCSWTGEAGVGGKIWWVVTWPIQALLYLTIPDCRREGKEKWYPLTFIMCILYIAITSYMVAWMITVVGDVARIPDSVMGLTFLAAGMSVPEAVSSVIVSNQGYGAMGISNSIGSNTFDVLLCLGLPWLIKAALMPSKDGYFVQINSDGILFSTISLLSTLILLYFTFALNKFKLDRKVGVVCLLIYACFLAFAAIIELNVFFHVNPPTCGR